MHLLEEGDAMVCLDARDESVDVPPEHKDSAALNLILNLNFRRPIEIMEDQINATLSFGGRPYPCLIPFSTVWAIFEPGTKKGQVWEEDLPQDINLLEQLQNNTTPSKPPKPKPVAKKSSSPKKFGTPKRDRSHLRVIK